MLNSATVAPVKFLKVEVSNYYIKQKNGISSTHLYGYVNILDLSTGLVGKREDLLITGLLHIPPDRSKV